LGIAFNPISLHHHLSLTTKDASELNVQEKQGIYFHTDFHSEFNKTNKRNYIQNVENQINKQLEQLKKCSTIFITYGTAWVYETVSEKQLANNCHKMPSKDFTFCFYTKSCQAFKRWLARKSIEQGYIASSY